VKEESVEFIQRFFVFMKSVYDRWGFNEIKQKSSIYNDGINQKKS
jgi:hypothetical protein